MSTLLGAIHQALVGLGVPVYNDEPPEGTDPASSYVVIENFAERERLVAFGGNKFVDGSWECVVYTVGTAQAETLAGQLKTALDLKTLAQSGLNMLSLQVGYEVTLDRTRSLPTRRVTEVRLPYRSLTANAN